MTAIKSLRALLSSSLARHGLQLRKFPTAGIRPLPVFDLTATLLTKRLLPRAVNFCQIGANDGIFVDPIHKYVEYAGWRGVLVEPQHTVFERLVANYQFAADRLRFLNIAVGPSDRLTLYSGRDRSTYATSVASRDPKVVARQLDVSTATLISSEVPCETLTNVVRNHLQGNLDVLQIDTEGYDWNVLQTLDLKQFRPSLIQIETGHLTRKTCSELAVHLTTHGYEIYWGGYEGDTVAVQRSQLGLYE